MTKSAYLKYQAVYYLYELLPILKEYPECASYLFRFSMIKNALSSSRKAARQKTQEKSSIAPTPNLQNISVFMKKISAEYTKLKQKPPFQLDNVVYLGELFQLKLEEKRIVDFLVAIQLNNLLRRILHRFSHDFSERGDVLETVGGLPLGAGYSVLKDNAPLMRLGILRKIRYSSGYQLTGWAQEFINTPHKDNTARYKDLMGNSFQKNDEFNAQDFSYIEAADLALRLMKRAKTTKGFNILLYGMPGTGKTSFAKVLAETAKMDLYPVGICNEGEPEKNYRLQQLYRKQFLLKNIKNACLLFDEGEDIFSSIETRTNKIEINNLLENNKVPVIWTTNKIHRMDPAYIRRFTLAVCFNKPPVEVRQKIWHKYLAENKIKCANPDTLALAKEYEVSPAMISGAAAAARMAKGNLKTVRAHLSFMTQALNGGYKTLEENKPENKFSPALIHADIDLNALTVQLKNLERLNFSLCLYGASGTGKSAYARYLAEELGLTVFQRRASNLISPYVGETEQNIAKAFTEAKENKSMLIFDEADSFLRDRSLATRSWEISSVNEMLTWMDSHPYPFICTTNLMDTLDPASLRRFSFKVKYDFLTSIQVKEAFAYFFGLDIVASQVTGLDKLTPGDFALVKNKAEILGRAHDFNVLKEMLLTEQQLKRNLAGGRIGFAAN